MLKTVIVVEDNWDHLEAADTLLNSRNIKRKRLGIREGRLTEFLKAFRYLLEDIDSGKIKKSEVGVLTDLFFPSGPQPGMNYEPSGDLAPLGLLVMSECRRLGIPCVIVTAGYHHGSKYNQICVAGRLLGWPEMIDSQNGRDPEAESKTKNWKEGLEELEKLAAKIRAD